MHASWQELRRTLPSTVAYLDGKSKIILYYIGHRLWREREWERKWGSGREWGSGRGRGVGVTVGVLVTVLGTAALAGCKGDEIDTVISKGFTYCTIMADPPLAINKQIEGPGRFRCDGAGADSITITVTLQQQGAKGWLTLATDAFVAHGKDTSRSRTETTRTRKVSANCTTGKFRTVVHSVEVSKGKTQTVDTHSVTVPNPCHL